MSGVKGVILGAAGRLVMVQNALGRTRNYNVDEDDWRSSNKGESGVVVREDVDDDKGGDGEEAVEAPGWMSTYCFNCYVNNINNLNWNVKNTFQFIFCHRIGIMQSTRLTMLLSVWNCRQPPAEERIEVRTQASSVKWPL